MTLLSRTLFTLFILGFLYLLVFWRTQPVAALPSELAVPTQFSAYRAIDLLRQILVDEAPHPVGSPANQRVRDRILAHLQTLGYQPEVQRAESCGKWGCATVENIVTSLPAASDNPAVLLVAHYDSVEEGMGAADDGSGVVIVLEVARILRQLGAFQNPILFLLTDGEEKSLLGARAFVAQHPQAQKIGVVINLEARGTSGASLMFETSEGNGWLVNQFAQAAIKPTASSLFFEIYKRLPNDTDLTIFKNAGMAGYGFAFIDEVEHYHTPNDNLSTLNLDTLQHQGENALALTRQLANADLSPVRADNLIYSDILSFFVMRYPLWLGQLLALLLLMGWLFFIWLHKKQGRISIKGIVIAGLAGLGALLLPFSLFLIPPARWSVLPMPGLWIVTLIVVSSLLIASIASKWSRALEQSLVIWLAWSVATLLLIFAVPGASIIFALPALCAWVLHWVLLRYPQWQQTIFMVAMIGAGVIWLKLMLLFEIALSILVGPAIIALPLAVLATTLLPILMHVSSEVEA